jgi:hypothetical protein
MGIYLLNFFVSRKRVAVRKAIAMIARVDLNHRGLPFFLLLIFLATLNLLKRFCLKSRVQYRSVHVRIKIAGVLWLSCHIQLVKVDAVLTFDIFNIRFDQLWRLYGPLARPKLCCSVLLVHR